MIKRLKQKLNELQWSIRYLFDIIDEEDDEMMNISLKENTMNIECKEYQIYIGCDDKRLYDDLHEAVDIVLKKHFAPVELCVMDGEDK